MEPGVERQGASVGARVVMDEPAISIVIVSWNTRQLLDDCIASIFRETSAPVEVIVVDNASTDGSGEMVEEKYPRARLIRNSSNRGFAAANNQGLRVSSGRFVLLLNPDTVVLDRALDRCIEFMDGRPDVGCLGCQVWESPDRIQRTCFRFPTLRSELAAGLRLDRVAPLRKLLGDRWMDSWDRRSARDVEVVSGMFLLLRREVMQRIGLLDESYFVYGEEADWCYQMQRIGVRRHFTPEPRILHLEGGGKSTAQRSVAMYVQHHRSLLVFFRKNHGRLSEAALRALILFRMTIRLLLGAVVLPAKPAVGRRVIAQCWDSIRLSVAERVVLRPQEGAGS